jgi:two-component system nitrate/nitrite sensor histidine kinase NarX
MLILLNYATDRSYNHIICPIGNSLHMLAIPLLAYVYLKELSIEKERAEASLSAYRDHLEELVEERTPALKKVNLQLNKEIGERKQAEMEIARHNDRLAAQNTVAATLSESLDLDVILNSALDAVLSLLVMEVGFIYLIDPEDSSLQLKINRGKFAREALQVSLNEECLCRQTSMNAVESGGVAIQYLDSAHDNQLSTCFSETKLLTLVSIPLVSKGRVVGVMTLGAARAQAIQQEDYELLIAIGQQIGMALENATLYQDAEHWSGELVRLHQASAGLTSALDTEQILQEIVRQSAWLLRCPIALVCSWLSSRQSVEIVASHGLTSAEEERLPNSPHLIPLLNELLRKQRSLAIHDVPLDGCTSAYGQNNGRTGNLICLPLRGQQQPREFLLLLDRQPGHVWQARELELIENFANRASVALIHANLHQQMERTAALEERQRIAADMHDGLAQMLSLLGLKVDRAHELLETGDNQATENELHQMREVVGRASDEARRSIARLQKPVRRQRSLQELLTKLIDQFQSEYSTPVSFSEQISEPLILPLEQRDLVLPVVQEALLNAQRHAQSQKIFLLLERHGDNIKITVEDDGRGFLQPRSQNSQAGHFGLSIMQARAARIGGQLEVDSTPGQGTRVTLKWSQKEEQQPVPAQDPEALSQPSTPILSLEVGL